MTRARRSLAYLPILALLFAPVSALARQAGSAAAEEDLDRKAKQLFVAGKYAEAIDILARLYTDTNDPIYLRNIGRCYQRLRDFDRAIASFEEYLLRAKNVSKTEREEIRGFIQDLEALKRDKGADARPPAPAQTPPPASAPVPAAPIGTAPPAAPPQPLPGTPLVPPAAPPEAMPATFATPPPAGEVTAGTGTGRPLARTISMAGMAVAGALAVGGGVLYAASWAKYKSAEKKCPGMYWCAQDAAKAVEGRNRLSKIFLLGAAVTGAASVTVFLLNPARPSQVALGVGGRF
jgi:tetratricopeptide (TPR) repeat protein